MVEESSINFSTQFYDLLSVAAAWLLLLLLLLFITIIIIIIYYYGYSLLMRRNAWNTKTTNLSIIVANILKIIFWYRQHCNN